MDFSHIAPDETFMDKARKRASRLLPCINWAKEYSMTHLTYDVLAGLTSAIIVVPQALSYANMAGIPLQHGLYAALACGIPYAIFGSTRDVQLGPTAVMTLVVAIIIDGCKDADQCVEWAASTAFMAGIMQFLLGLINFGALTAIISGSVLSGFSSACAVVVILNQLPHWLGYSVRRPFFQCIYDIFKGLPNMNGYNFCMGFGSFLALMILGKVGGKFAKTKATQILVACRSIFVIFVGLIICFAYYKANGNDMSKIPFKTIGLIPSGLPSISIPIRSFGDKFPDLVKGAIIIAVVGLCETLSIGVVYSKKRANLYMEYRKQLQNDPNTKPVDPPYRVSANQELVALGVANFVSGIVGGMGVTGSFARSACANLCGVFTPFSNILSFAVTVGALLFMAPLLKFVPLPALAAVIIAGVVNVIDIDIIVDSYKLGSNAMAEVLITIITWLSVMILGIEEGLVIGIAVHVAWLLFKQANPPLTAHAINLGPHIGGRIVVVDILGPVHYLAAPKLLAKIQKVARYYTGNADAMVSSLPSAFNSDTHFEANANLPLGLITHGDISKLNTDLTPPELSHDGTPLSALILDLSRATDWDLTGLQVLQSISEHFATNSLTSTSTACAIHVIINPHSYRWLQSMSFLAGLKLGFSPLAPELHVHYNIDNAIKTIQLQAQLLDHFLHAKVIPTKNGKIMAIIPQSEAEESLIDPSSINSLGMTSDDVTAIDYVGMDTMFATRQAAREYLERNSFKA